MPKLKIVKIENQNRNLSKLKIANLIGTLVYRALVICSKSKLQQELDYIQSILRRNGYPEVIINLTISKKIARFYQPVKEGPQKCPAYLK